MKKYNTLDASVMLYGISYGEHTMNPEGLVSELDELLTGRANSFLVRLWKSAPLSEETYLAIARFAKERSMPFGFLYASQHAPEGEKCHIIPSLLEKIKSISGELFLGEVFGEAGSEVGAKDKGYFTEGRRPDHSPMPDQATKTMTEAADTYVNYLGNMTEYAKSIGMKTAIVEATALSSYAMRAGVETPILEVCPADANVLIPFTRGAAISFGRRMWGGFIAHEWYAGFKHDDALKIKRLELFYKHLFISGANIIFLESGVSEIDSFGTRLESDSDICENYRRVMKASFEQAMKTPRPCHGPIARVAFVIGKDDGYTGFMGGNAWCRFDREEWGKSDAERSWDILDSVYRSDLWSEPLAYAQGGRDLSNAPAYGSYDIISSDAPLECMSGYDYLIFLGWNTMTEELYAKLTDYVSGGGTLLMSAAHLSKDGARLRNYTPVMGGDLTRLFGCSIVGAERRSNGMKFTNTSDVSGLHYPGTPDLVCDPIFANGYATYAKIVPQGAKVKAQLCDRFGEPVGDAFPVVIENKCGKGVAILTANLSYPGDPAVKDMYQRLVKGLLGASHEGADVKVYGSDKVRFSLFEDDKGCRVLYLLSTDFEIPVSVKIEYSGKCELVTLEPMELKVVEL